MRIDAAPKAGARMPDRPPGGSGRTVSSSPSSESAAVGGPVTRVACTAPAPARRRRRVRASVNAGVSRAGGNGGRPG